MARVRAPELRGAGGWIGVDGLTLAGLRGRVVLLDFWTSACINCLRVAEELRGLERRFAEELVVVGIHSPKFPHEGDHAAVRAAVARHRVEHPVLDDPGLETWDQYAVRAWPTTVLVDPEGYEVGRWSGEGHAVEVAALVEQTLATHGGAGRARGTVGVEPEAGGTGELSFPGKVCGSPDGLRLAIADTGHDRVLVCARSGEVLAEHGGLYQPQGVRFDGEDLLVCETGADRVWRLGPDGARTLLASGLASPWDVVVWHGHVVIAEAGRHRLWAIDAAGEPQVVAGMGGEGLYDAPALEAGLAQPSGLAVTAEGELAFLDAEASALRVLDRPAGTVRTLVGQGLFDWGAADGDRSRARLQHPLGLAAARERGPDGAPGALWVADTFNGALRVWRERHLWTVPVTGLAEPGGLDVLPDGQLVVADTANHRIVVVHPELAEATTLDVGRPGSVDVAAPVVAEAFVLPVGGELEVVLDLETDGDELDAAGGAPVRLWARADAPGLLADGDDEVAWELDALPARVALRLGPEPASGRVTVELRAATCTPDACRVRRTQRAYDLILT
jgi:thiol-disulfide isomerase/thioredoxin